MGPIPKILVTGSRGKSSVVRLIHAALAACGINAYARITGVVPRQLTPKGSRVIVRTAGAHVQEMKWWLNQLPPHTGAVVLENSAVAPELQGLAAQWLKPDLVVLTNTVADHQEVWGPGVVHAARVLVRGIPRQSRVVVTETVASDPMTSGLLKERGCRLAPVETDPSWDHWQINGALALAATEYLGLDPHTCRAAVQCLDRDLHDFQVRPFGAGQMATAFTVNDIQSTRTLFEGLGWHPGETRILYNHRRTRGGRLKSFCRWFSTLPWQRVDIMGDRPLGRIPGAAYLSVKTPLDLAAAIGPGEKVFGCGNVVGLPLSLFD